MEGVEEFVIYMYSDERLDSCIFLSRDLNCPYVFTNLKSVCVFSFVFVFVTLWDDAN